MRTASTLTRALAAEALKLPGSLALMSCVAAPLMLGVLCFLATLGGADLSWGSLIGSLALALWAVFLFPMAIAAFATSLAQLEHADRNWTYLLALPVPRWVIYASKLILVVVGAAAMATLATVLSVLGGAAGGLVATMPDGPLPLGGIVRMSSTILLAALFLSVLQTWAALRLRSFVASIGVGMVGVLASLTVLMSGTSKLDWFPWVYPMIAVTRPDQLGPWLLVSALGAAVAGVLMLLDLCSRPAP